jgi:LmbE family N-acetylglucosaminyl deacetylase
MRILVLAPHTDDGEFGCGGSIARFASEGNEVHYVAFSAAEKSVPAEYPNDVLRKEVVNATAILKIPKANLQVLNFEVRDFPAHRQEILEVMVKIQISLKPDMVLLPSTYDVHQDHQTIANEGFRAFKRTTLLGYDLPWNTLNFATNMFIHLKQEHIDLKLAALAEYKSQAGRPYATKGFIEGLARTRGVQTGTEFAEAFECIRWVIH